MQKFVKDLLVVDAQFLREDYILLHLTDTEAPLPPMQPGQFVNIAVPAAPNTFLRRPISINYVDHDKNVLELLIHAIGEGTWALTRLKPGDKLNLIYPLGQGFEIPNSTTPKKYLLVGGGVGTAPMLLYGKMLKAEGHEPVFLLGGRSEKDILQRERFEQIGRCYYTTEDQSLGERGFVTHHSILQTEMFDSIAACGPKPMMLAVAKYAKNSNTPCHVSLENLMACGVGACLVCVEKTVRGNLCACTEGPVFNIEELTWEY